MLLVTVRVVGFAASLEAILALPFLATALVGLLFSRISYRLTIGPVRRILTEISN
jgi:hypothetical protein